MAGQMQDAVAERVGAAIATSGHTLEEVADQAGMRRMVLRRHLAAPERLPLRIEDLEALARALGVPEQLLTRPRLQSAS